MDGTSDMPRTSLINAPLDHRHFWEPKSEVTFYKPGSLGFMPSGWHGQLQRFSRIETELVAIRYTLLSTECRCLPTDNYVFSDTHFGSLASVCKLLK